MNKFKIGDRVRVTKTNGCEKIGSIGTVLEDSNFPNVRFDNRNIWYIRECCMELLDQTLRNQIHVTTKGTDTIAVLTDGKKEIRRAVAKCSPSDKFDFEVGAKLAFARLIGGVFIGGVDMAVSETKKEDGLVIELLCIEDYKPGEWLTKGKTYIFKDGAITYDDGYKPGKVESYEAWKRLNPALSSCLIVKPQVKEVKRVAKVGDHIKIVKTGCHGPRLNIGDIHTVTEISGMGNIHTDKHNVFCKENRNEYIVLENYTPSESKSLDLSTISNEDLIAELQRRLSE